MKRVYLVVAVCLLAVLGQGSGFAGSRISFEDLAVRNELNPGFGLEAKQLADKLGLPRAIVLTRGVVIDAMGIEDGRPIYAVMSNLAHPFQGAEVLTYDEVVRQYDVSKGIVNPTGPVVPDGGRVATKTQSSVLLVPDWTADKVMAFDPQNGNLLDSAFIPSNNVALASPKEARLSPWMRITVSDQITDLVQAFDTSGAYLGPFAPVGGVNNAILDNIRGHAYRPNRHLVVTVASGANQNCIAEFDSAGNYLGQFIAAGAGGLNSPFSILFRATDILISTSSAPIGVLRYDLNGTFIDIWASISSFPQQIAQLSSGNIAVANFSGTGQTGIRLYNSSGTFLRLLSGVTGNRGVFQLQNGNFLTSNGAGIHEIDSASGNLVRTVALGANMQFINRVDLTLVGVDEVEALPTATTLLQNYPNPLNPSTSIKYQVAEVRSQMSDILGHRSSVSLRIFDLLGREVATLVNEQKPPGNYSVTWNAKGVASGVYLCRLSVDGMVQTRRMVMLR